MYCNYIPIAFSCVNIFHPLYIFSIIGIPEDLLDVIGDKQICYLVNNDYDKPCNHTCNHVSHDLSDIEKEKEKDSECDVKVKGKKKKKSSTKFVICLIEQNLY